MLVLLLEALDDPLELAAAAAGLVVDESDALLPDELSDELSDEEDAPLDDAPSDPFDADSLAGMLVFFLPSAARLSVR